MPPERFVPGVVKKTWTVDDDGYASLPEGPGIGVEVDEAMLAKRAAEPDRTWKWPEYYKKDGSVSDY